MHDDVIVNKIETIRRCIIRIQEEYIGFENELDQNYTKQDSIILNLERVSQATIDLSTHIIRINSFGIPKTSRDVFEFLYQHKVISKNIAQQMKKMVGFRNLAVHDYQNISLDIVKSIVEKHLGDFETFIEEIIHA
jgi:uncharacterized protein YutE (UPF0331/DUF86 family)